MRAPHPTSPNTSSCCCFERANNRSCGITFLVIGVILACATFAGSITFRASVVYSKKILAAIAILGSLAALSLIGLGFYLKQKPDSSEPKPTAPIIHHATAG